MKILYLDAGHGYNTAGKRTPNGEREWTLNNNVCNYITSELTKYEGITVVRTDDTTGATDISLTNRMKKVQAAKPHLFVSIHHNANTSKWGSWTGVEAYAHPQAPTLDKDLATKAAQYVSAATGLKNRGMKTADFQVLRECPVSTPAVLVEGGFMDSTIDHPVIISAKGQQAYAQGVVKMIVEYLGLKLKPASNSTTTSSTSGDTYYRVIVGSYKDKANAEKAQKALKDKGFDSFLEAFKK